MDHEGVQFDSSNADEVIMPGFRFHPTDEELVGFYLKRKLLHKPVSIELIKQLDIYKYDPWDLPEFSTSIGAKEWYFYCPRDRKYRNSSRPNRVTRGGFWKATGRDKPIYSSEGTRCIGLKKSLVFYKGRAATGIKTDWMMHEFRLPSPSDPNYSQHPQKPFHLKTTPNIANESWAICKVFMKAGTLASRGAQSHSWLLDHKLTETTLFSSKINLAHLIEPNQSCIQQQQMATVNLMGYKHPGSTSCSFTLSPAEMSTIVNVPTMLDSFAPKMHGDMEQPSQSFDYEQQQQPWELGGAEAEILMKERNVVRDDQWQAGAETDSYPFNLFTDISNGWKPDF